MTAHGSMIGIGHQLVSRPWAAKEALVSAGCDDCNRRLDLDGYDYRRGCDIITHPKHQMIPSMILNLP